MNSRVSRTTERRRNRETWGSAALPRVQSLANEAKLGADVGACMSCLVCHEQRPLVGVACAECLEALRPAFAITPEQVRMRGGRGATTSVLVDSWGRTHALRRRTVVGRVLDEEGLEILDATISRQHACLELRDDTWFVRDFGSSNGTFVEGQRIEAETPLRDGERVRFGAVELFFLDAITAPPDVDTNALGGFTVRDPLRGATTQPLPKRIAIELREPTGGGGGVAVIDGKPVQLTVPQFELVALLYQRAQSGKSGFVPASELVHTLSLDSVEPSEDHIRQLVRRLRRVLFKAGISGLVESRYGSGYRLALLRS